MTTRDVATSTDESADSDSLLTLSSSGKDSVEWEPETPPLPDVTSPLMPRPTNEIPLLWRTVDIESEETAVDLRAILPKDATVCLPPARPQWGQAREGMNVRAVKVDTREPTRKTRGIERLDLHTIVDLHRQLERERRSMPGELIVSGKISGLAVDMLVDSGASVSVLSTVYGRYCIVFAQMDHAFS